MPISLRSLRLSFPGWSMTLSSFHCREALDPEDPAVERARELYDATQADDEKIPWEWISGAVADRPRWRPGRWSPHLLLAARSVGKKAPETVFGFCYGLHLPGYGGYLTYIGVDPAERGRGVGTRLVQLLVRLFAVDAVTTGDTLPFVVWESRPPRADQPVERDRWRSRLRLFDRVGGLWLSGVSFHAVNYNDRKGPAIPLQLFLLPVDSPPERFDAPMLRGVVLGLAKQVYRLSPEHRFMKATLEDGWQPQTRPIAEALELTRQE